MGYYYRFFFFLDAKRGAKITQIEAKMQNNWALQR